MRRTLLKNLIEWKDDPKRKPLLLRGARQVVKTWLVRELGKSFKHFIEVNFEENKEAKSFFRSDLDPGKIAEVLSVYFDIPIITGKTLVFFDEMQACPEALSSLRFF
jgi:uncharacterized protein